MTEKKFSFTLQKKSFHAFEANSTRALFQKWGFTRFGLQVYSYDNCFNVALKESFVHAFFSSPEVKSSFQTFGPGDVPVNMANFDFVQLSTHLIPSSITNMNFFDRLYENLLVQENGEIQKCFDEPVDEFTVSDELCKLILSPDSEFKDAFSQEERKEFLFLLFTHLVLGGQFGQSEDNVKPYLETTKHIYKDLLNVREDRNTGQLHVSSTVLMVRLHGTEGKILFPGTSENHQNFCYMIVDPEVRQVVVWHHIWTL